MMRDPTEMIPLMKGSFFTLRATLTSSMMLPSSNMNRVRESGRALRNSLSKCTVAPGRSESITSKNTLSYSRYFEAACLTSVIDLPEASLEAICFVVL